MINFLNDYNSPGHPDILRAVTGAATCKYPGYCDDAVSEQAKQKIIALLDGRGCIRARDRYRAGDAHVHFLAGGTQANLTAMSAFLRPHEAVIAAGSSHIQVHETGAIEAAGHRILLTENGAGGAVKCGKLFPDEVRKLCRQHDNEHMVKPRLVYISQSTELGGVYTLQELVDLRRACDENNLLLYMDGARLAIALTAPDGDARLSDVADLCDAFYIGGTKNGLMYGEAMVIINDSLKADFRYIQKQRGGMPAKGFLLGLQFNALFEDDLFYKLAAHANKMAERLRIGLGRSGRRFLVSSRTNQLFPILRISEIEKLEKRFLFERWEAIDDEYAAIRFVTSWNTSEEEVDALLAAIDKE